MSCPSLGKILCFSQFSFLFYPLKDGVAVYVSFNEKKSVENRAQVNSLIDLCSGVGKKGILKLNWLF